MDVELARTFLAVVETGSFLSAADRINVTQSTVSIRIRTLERQVGKLLFERGKSGASLTVAGRHFQRHAQGIVRIWTQAKLDVALPEHVDTALEIGAVPSLWDGFLSVALPGLHDALPQVAIKATSATSDNLSRQLADGSIGLAVGYRPQNVGGLVVENLFADEYVLVSSDKDTTSDPLGPGYVLIDWGPEFRADHVLNFPAMKTPRLQLGLGTMSLQYLGKVPASGYFPRRIVEPEVRRGWLRVIDHAPTFAYAAYAMYNSGQPTPFVEEAAHYLRQVAHAQFG